MDFPVVKFFNRLDSGFMYHLLCRSFTDGGDQKGFDSDSGIVDFLLGKSGINDKNDSVDGQRSFGDVSRNNNLEKVDWETLEV